MVFDVLLATLIISVVSVGGVILTSILGGIVYRVFRELLKNLW